MIKTSSFGGFGVLIMSNELQEQLYLGQYILLTGIFPLRSFKACLTMMENSISNSMCAQSSMAEPILGGTS